MDKTAWTHSTCVSDEAEEEAELGTAELQLAVGQQTNILYCISI